MLNSTHVQTGQRVVTSAFTWKRLSALDLFDTGLDTADVSFVGAVHNSARFTYVSPAGAYYDKTARFAGQLVDGGYFDNSGACTLVSPSLTTIARVPYCA